MLLVAVVLRGSAAVLPWLLLGLAGAVMMPPLLLLLLLPSAGPGFCCWVGLMLPCVETGAS